MNAPAAGGISDAVFENLPLTAIAPSETTSQARRRKRYTAESIAEFANNIVGTRGIVEPIIVRRLAGLRDLAAYELIAGERRWLASREAGFAHIPALIRDVPDADLSLFQLSENLQRENIAPLEEAEALDDLIKVRGIDKEQAAELVGKSKRHVYNRLKLLHLTAPAVLDALESGRLHHTKALRIANFRGDKIQRKAFELVGDESISLRQAEELLRDKFMVRLDDVPFDVAETTYATPKPGQFPCQHGTEALPACVDCENCSSTDAELNEQVIAWYGPQAKVCTDKPCHDFKVKTFFDLRLRTALAEGRTIIDGDEAKTIRGDSWNTHLYGYVDLDVECNASLPAKLLKKRPDLRDLQYMPTFRQVIGEEELRLARAVIAVLIDPFNKQPREVLRADDAEIILKGLGIDFRAPRKTEAPRAPSAAPEGTPESRLEEREAERAEAEKQAAREEQERVFRRKLLSLVHEKWKGPLKRDELQSIADFMMNNGEWPEFVDELHGGQISTGKMKEPELARLLFSLTIGNCVDYLADSPTLLLAAAKRFKIDHAKVRKQVKAELIGKGVK